MQRCCPAWSTGRIPEIIEEFPVLLRRRCGGERPGTLGDRLYLRRSPKELGFMNRRRTRAQFARDSLEQRSRRKLQRGAGILVELQALPAPNGRFLMNTSIQHVAQLEIDRRPRCEGELGEDRQLTRLIS